MSVGVKTMAMLVLMVLLAPTTNMSDPCRALPNIAVFMHAKCTTTPVGLMHGQDHVDPDQLGQASVWLEQLGQTSVWLDQLHQCCQRHETA